MQQFKINNDVLYFGLQQRPLRVVFQLQVQGRISAVLFSIKLRKANYVSRLQSNMSIFHFWKFIRQS